MVSNIDLLDSVQIAAPCHADWERMESVNCSDRVRHCSECRLNVYNLSEMSRQEALSLLSQHEGRLCVRFYRRSDGTILTNNCPVGLRAVRRLFLKRLASVASLCALLFDMLASHAPKPAAPLMGSPEPAAPLMGRMAVETPPVPKPTAVEMGFVVNWTKARSLEKLPKDDAAESVTK